MLLGIDIGTTGVKSILFDRDGIVKGYGFQEYEVTCERPGEAVQDPEFIWSCTKKVICESVKDMGESVQSLSLSAQGDAVIPVNKDGNAIGKAYLGMDYRGVKQVKWCEETIGARTIFEKTGMRPHPMNSMIKIMWIKENEPELYEKAYKIVTYTDYIMKKLGSNDFVIDYTMASRTMGFHLTERKWDLSILKAMSVDKEKLSAPVPSGTYVGDLNQSVAKELGITSTVKLITGGHDQVCAAVGAGIVKEGMALDSHGTAEVISTVLNQAKTGSEMYQGFYPCYIHAIPEQYFTFALNHTSGILLRWYVEEFCRGEKMEAEKDQQSVYERLFDNLPEEPSSIYMLPYLNGSGDPTCDLNMKGAFVGLEMATNRYDVAKAVLEAQAFEMRLNLETLRDTKIDIRDLRCVGGGARTDKGLQLKADILGVPVSTLEVREAACYGAAIIAGLGAGIYKSLDEATKGIRVKRTFIPNPEKTKLYDDKFALYKELAQSMKKFMHKI